MNDTKETTHRDTTPLTDLGDLKRRLIDCIPESNHPVRLAAVSTAPKDHQSATSTLDHPHDDGDHTLRDSKACLSELPVELLVGIVEYLNGDFCDLRHLAQTSQRLKHIADGFLYADLCNTDQKKVAVVQNNPQLATCVKNIRWLVGRRDDSSNDCRLYKLLDTTLNIEHLEFVSLNGLLFEEYDETFGFLKHHTFATLSQYPLQTLDFNAKIDTQTLHLALSLPSLHSLIFSIHRKSFSGPWVSLQHKSKVRSLSFDGYGDYTVISQMLLSIESLEHLAYHQSRFNEDEKLTKCEPWEPIAESLAPHKSSLKSLRMRFDLYADFRALSALQDFPKLQTLSLDLRSIEDALPEELNWVQVLPEKLEHLEIILGTTGKNTRFYFEQLVALKDHRHLKVLDVGATWGNTWMLLEKPLLPVVSGIFQAVGSQIELQGFGFRVIPSVVDFHQDLEGFLSSVGEELDADVSRELTEEELMRMFD